MIGAPPSPAATVRLRSWIDDPANPRTGGPLLRVRGWCFDEEGAPITGIRARVNGRLTAGSHGWRRPDVQAAFQGPAASAESGFGLALRLSPGINRVRLEAERPGIKIVILSDACWPGAAEVAAQPGIELFRVGTVVGNAAITRLTARPTKADPHVQQVLVEVRNFADESMTGRLLVALSGKEIDAVPLTIAANGRWQHVFQFTSDRPEQLTARLEPSDVLAADNEAAASLQQSDIDVAPMHDLRVPGNVGVAIDSLLLRVAGPPLWMVLTVAAALLCAVEWCLYQRRWVG